jgi:hypothetical protein
MQKFIVEIQFCVLLKWFQSKKSCFRLSISVHFVLLHVELTCAFLTLGNNKLFQICFKLFLTCNNLARVHPDIVNQIIVCCIIYSFKIVLDLLITVHTLSERY